MRGEPPHDDRGGVLVQPSYPKVNSGGTEIFTDVGARTLARMTFARPRSMVVYAFWDPYKNNPGPTAPQSMRLAGSGNEIVAIGRLQIGNQGSMIEFNFDLSWGQLVAIPVTCEQVEVVARLIDPVVLTSGGTDDQAFNDPPALIIPPGSTLPNPSAQHPTGFVAITGGIATGSASPTGAQVPTRSAFFNALAAFPGVGDSVTCPIAFGARRVTVLSSSALAASTEARIITQGGLIQFPINTRTVLPPNAYGVEVLNTAGAGGAPGFVIWELGI